MNRWQRIMVMLVALALCGACAPVMSAHPALALTPARNALQVSVQPHRIPLGRDVPLVVVVTDRHGRRVDGANVSIIGAGRPAFGRTRRGRLTLVVRAVASGQVHVEATHPGYTPAGLTVPIVPGSPASVVAIRHGMSVLAPRGRPRPGHVGADLFDQYHALTGARQYASLNLRDGSLIDLNSNTNVLIIDPLVQRLSKGELFMEVVHGSASHVVRVGRATATTKGTRFDIRIDSGTHAARITVVEGQLQVANGKASVLVGAGQQTTIVGARPPTPPARVNLGPVLAWIRKLPNTSSTTVPPVLNLPPPPSARVTPPATPGIPKTTVSGTITNTTWTTAGSPYEVQGSVDVPTGTSLTIEPGVVIEVDGGSVSIEGTLRARGTDTAPIVFTSSAAQPAPANWHDLVLSGPGASGSVLDHVQVYYAGYGSPGALVVAGGAAPAIGHSVIARASGDGLYVDDASRPRIADCLFASNGSVPASLPVDDVALFTGTGTRIDTAGIEVRSAALGRDATWPYTGIPLILGSLDVPRGRTLTLSPGVVIEVSGGSVTVEGTLRARGTDTAPVVFTSSAAQPAPSNWHDLVLSGPGASGSVLDHVQVYYAGYASSGAVTVAMSATPTIRDSVIAQAGGDGLYVDDTSRPHVVRCIFANNGGMPVSLPVDDVPFFTGNSIDTTGIEVRTTTLTRDATWPYTGIPLILGSLDVPQGRTLTLSPGVVIEVNGGGVTVEGTLRAQGTDGAPIVFTSAQAQPAPANWHDLVLSGPGASASVLDHVQVYYAGYGSPGAITVAMSATPTIRDSVIAQASGDGLYADDTSRPHVVRCVFANEGGVPASLPVDDVPFFTANSIDAGVPGIEVRTTTLTRDATWPYTGIPLILGSLDVPRGRTLTLSPGVVIKISGGGVSIEGTLRAQGTAAAPVVFTSAQAQPAPANWHDLVLSGPGASGSMLDHVQVYYAGYGSPGALVVAGGAAPTIQYSVIAQASGDGLYADDTSRPTVIFCRFQDDAGYALSVPAADAARVHDNTVTPGRQGPQLRG